MGQFISIGMNENTGLTISEPQGAVSHEDARLIRGLRLLNVGLLIRTWMKQDIGENIPEFEEKYAARCREMGKTLRSIFPEIGAQH